MYPNIMGKYGIAEDNTDFLSVMAIVHSFSQDKMLWVITHRKQIIEMLSKSTVKTKNLSSCHFITFHLCLILIGRYTSCLN